MRYAVIYEGISSGGSLGRDDSGYPETKVVVCETLKEAAQEMESLRRYRAHVYELQEVSDEQIAAALAALLRDVVI